MAAFSGGVSACHFEEIRQRKSRDKGIGKKAGCFGSKRGRGLRDRIKQFSIWYNEKEEYKAKDYSQRRSNKKKKRALISREACVKRLRWLYLLTALVWVVGLIMTFCSTVKTIGKNTTFFEKKETYRIVGPIIISVGVLLLFLAEGLKMNFKLNEGHVQTKFYIIQNSNKKRKSSSVSKETSVDSSNFDDIGRNGSKTNKKRKLYQISTDECISIEELDADVPKKSNSNKRTFDFIESDIKDKGALDTSNGRRTNWRDQWTRLSNESDDSTVTNNNTGTSDNAFSHRSPKRKRHDWKRFHWTKLSQESSGSEFIVIDENEAMESSGDSTSFRRQLQEAPRSPNCTFENPLARQLSVSSRASTTSKYSNFSDDAPLIKR